MDKTTQGKIIGVRKSQKMNEQALEALMSHIKVGVTEKYLAEKFIQIAQSLWADWMSFPPIIAFQENGAAPHHTLEGRR